MGITKLKYSESLEERQETPTMETFYRLPFLPT